MERERGMAQNDTTGKAADAGDGTAARSGKPHFGRGRGREDLRATVERIPAELFRNLSRGEGVLFVGPELSRYAGVRLRELLREAIANQLRTHVGSQDAEGLEDFLHRASPAEAAQALHDQLGRERFLRFVGTRLVHHQNPPTPLLYALRGLGFRRIFTTNLDRLLERAWENPLEGTPDLDVVVPAPDLRPGSIALQSRPLLIKLFGDIERTETLILTSDDYESFWRLRPELVSKLKAMLEVGPTLFVGYRLNDPEFRRIYTQVGPLLARTHRRAYAIVEDVSRFEVQTWTQRALTILPSAGAEGLEPLLRELHRHMTRHIYPGTELEAEGPATRAGSSASWPLSALIRAQLDHHLTWWLMVGASSTSPVRERYVPLDLIPESGHGQERELRLESLLRDSNPNHAERLQAPRAVELLSELELHPRILVLGPAGSGKTTLLLSTLRARGEASLEAGDRQLVMYMPLNQVAAQARLSLHDCLLEQLKAGAQRDSWDDVETSMMDALFDGRALLLLDGLDDMPEDVRPGVLERLSDLVRACPRVKLVLSCRTGAFRPEQLATGLDLALYEVAPFSSEQTLMFIRDQLDGDVQSSDTLMALLRAGVAPWLRRLAGNPLHLLLIAHRFARHGRFEESRADLYASYLNHLLRQPQNIQENQLYAWDKELLLQAVALYATLNPLEPLSEEVLIDLIDKEMARVHMAPMKDADRRVDARDALDEITRGSGILAGPGPRRSYFFRHSALREYLAARRLIDSPELDSLIARHAGDPRFAGIWRLLSAMQADATELLRKLETGLPAEAPQSTTSSGAQWSPTAARIIQRCFGEARRVQPSWLKARFRKGPEQRFGVLLSRLHTQLSHQESIELYGEILWQDQELYMRDGRRGDARALYVALTGLLRLIEEEGPTAHQAAESIAGWRSTGEATPEAPWPSALVEVPGGPFLMGEAGQLHHRFVQVETFQLGRDPVTVAQYLAFNPSHTLDDEPLKTEFMGDLMPVVGVSWFDAWVCAQWYGCRLPREAEWEKAAAWDSERQVRRSWPWGDEWEGERCNHGVDPSRHRCTTPVDRYGSLGESVYGCRDMTGNVLEWTLDLGAGLLERRVCKGGNWQCALPLLKPSAAVWLKPTYRGPGVGFRFCLPLLPTTQLIQKASHL